MAAIQMQSCSDGGSLSGSEDELILDAIGEDDEGKFFERMMMIPKPEDEDDVSELPPLGMDDEEIDHFSCLQDAAVIVGEFEEAPVSINILGFTPIRPDAEFEDDFEYVLKPPKLRGEHYLIGHILGEGSYGKVKDALDTRNLQRRAAKILKQKKLKKLPLGEENVMSEIKLHRPLSHRNVVNLIETFEVEEKEKIYVIMDYCPTVLQELLESTKSRKLPAEQCHRYFHDLIDGLGYLHDLGIIHKDIKPGNLLISNEDIIKISDFGVAEQLDLFAGNDLIVTSQGSPVFQSPEVSNGDFPVHGFKLDVWSSGVTLYNMVSGLYPFNGDNVYQILNAIIRGEYEMPGDLNTDLEELISGMLTFSGERRFSLQQVRSHIWFRRHLSSLGSDIKIPPYKGTCDNLRTSTVIISLQKVLSQQEGSQAPTDETGNNVRSVKSDMSLDPSGSSLLRSNSTTVQPPSSCSSMPSRGLKKKKKHCLMS